MRKSILVFLILLIVSLTGLSQAIVLHTTEDQIEAEYIHFESKTDNVLNIEFVETVDEMQTAPVELYFYTNDTKYRFDGHTVVKVADLIQ